MTHSPEGDPGHSPRPVSRTSGDPTETSELPDLGGSPLTDTDIEVTLRSLAAHCEARLLPEDL
ncbi:hypothetical protein [Streptomyces huasconensis]|uniref:hypothetical protein n=1 Tax=Streptomyces huasconensis TaxID=1854574 RepID=UPI0036F5AF4D